MKRLLLVKVKHRALFNSSIFNALLYRPSASRRSFTAESTPKALRSAHDTKAGVWGVIVVEQGRLVFVDCRNPDARLCLGVGRHEVIEPQVKHFVEPASDCVFHVELLRPVSEG